MLADDIVLCDSAPAILIPHHVPDRGTGSCIAAPFQKAKKKKKQRRDRVQGWLAELNSIYVDTGQ